MAKQIKPTTKNSPAIKVGANRDNKAAEAYAGRAKEVNMTRAVSHEQYSNQGYPVAGDMNAKTPSMVVSIGANKTSNMNGEVTMRGHGAATKGIKCRGPMG
jgi:hypothetical protein